MSRFDIKYRSKLIGLFRFFVNNFLLLHPTSIIISAKLHQHQPGNYYQHYQYLEFIDTGGSPGVGKTTPFISILKGTGTGT